MFKKNKESSNVKDCVTKKVCIYIYIIKNKYIFVSKHSFLYFFQNDITLIHNNSNSLVCKRNCRSLIYYEINLLYKILYTFFEMFCFILPTFNIYLLFI